MGVSSAFLSVNVGDAYRMSVDFEKTFIQCIVYNYDVIKEYGDEGKVRAAGKVMTKGKDYEVADGDIILSKYLFHCLVT